MKYEQAGIKGIRAPKFIQVGQSLADISKVLLNSFHLNGHTLGFHT